MSNFSTVLSVELVPTDQLSLKPSNPRINDLAVEHVAASIVRSPSSTTSTAGNGGGER